MAVAVKWLAGIGWWQQSIQVNFVLIPSEAEMRQHELTWILGLKIFAISLGLCHDLPSQFGRLFLISQLFTLAVLNKAAPFLQLM